MYSLVAVVERASVVGPDRRSCLHWHTVLRPWSGGIPSIIEFPLEVSAMPSWVDGKLDWSIFPVAISIGAAAVFLVSLLDFVFEFDLAASPVWQVGVFHLALALLFSMTLVVASPPAR